MAMTALELEIRISFPERGLMSSLSMLGLDGTRGGRTVLAFNGIGLALVVCR